MSKFERFWKIDTLDTRGGLAFASCFEVYNSNEAVEHIFIGTPGFRPESTANGALSWSAGRGCFQIGLFIGEVEVKFPTANDVAEFVRRAYLKSGGGDGADGGGESPPPRPDNPPEMPESLIFLSEGYENSELALANQIRNSLEDFQEISSNMKLGKVNPFDKWPDLTDVTANNNRYLLVSAAYRLLHEILLRLPANTDTQGQVRWLRDARCLDALITRLELWPLLRRDPYIQPLRNLITDLEYRFSNLSKIFPIYMGYIGLGFANPNPMLSTHFQRDIVSYLSRMPLPKSLENLTPPDQNNRASLYHLLVSFMGSPNQFSCRQEAIELVMFASACIVGPKHGIPLMILEHPSLELKLLEAAIDTNVNNAWKWLREHLPRAVFPKSLEEAIATADRLRYSAV